MAAYSQTCGCAPAVEKVEQFLSDDSRFKTLSCALNASSQKPSLSGLQDIDYPNLDGSLRIPLISNLTTVPLPTQVMEQFVNMQENCALGIFPEISRAWLSVDSSIFFWAYDNASDVAYYDGLNQTIISVHLIKPRPNVFKSHIKYLLCLVSSREIVLLGVTCPDDENPIPTVLLLPDPVFRLSTDNVLLSVIACSDLGRIFLGGNDGCLYEIVYQAEEGWFSRRCRKINHSCGILSYVTPSFLNFSEPEPIAQIEIDSSRHLLFARTEKSTLILYDLGDDGQSMTQVASKSLSAVVNQASCIARTIDTSNFKPITRIKAITKKESESIHLVAVTQAGVRLYFAASGGTRPSSLDLVHVRLPPGFTPTIAMQRPNSVSNIYHKDNTFIMTSTQTETKDLLWVLSNDFYVYEDQMMEAVSINSLGGRVWCIAEETRPSIARIDSECPIPPLVVKQHYEERRKFILLTSEGIHIFYKQRPIDQLKMLLLEYQNPEAIQVRSFFQSTKLTEACLTSLIVASSSNLPQEAQLVELAALTFFRYGGEPRLTFPSGQNASFAAPSMSTPISSPIVTSASINVSPIASRYNTNHNNTSLGATDQMSMQFSPRHDAVYLYLARILRPIWLLKIASIETINGSEKVLRNVATTEEVSLYLKRLIELKNFIDLKFDSKPENNNQRANAANAMVIEKESINLSSVLLTRCIEVLNLYKLICEHQFGTICASLPHDPQIKLGIMTFRDLIVMGFDMTTSIASALVRRYLDDNVTTDAISRRLYELCPSIFRQENALQAKAHEMILKSRTIVDKADKERIMNEAVSLLKKIGIRLDLQAVCDLLHSARAYKYIVDVCLFVAEKRDPLNLAGFNQSRIITTALDDNEERQKATAISYRMDCYMKIIDTLDRLMNKEDFNPVFESCVKSQDELFHTRLYEWLCEKSLSSKLLEVQSPYVETFLKKKADTDSFSTNYLDLMWKFYERRGNFFAAAQILDKLACKPTTDYGLDERLEYLSRAKGCIEAVAAPSESLHELEEKIEVIRIQIQVARKLRELPETPAILDAISQLNYSLSDLNTLYQGYAQKFALFDCQLATLKCGNHYDPALIEKLWKSIIDEVLQNNAQESAETRLHILANRIENLGKSLLPSERFFPVYYIIAYLEYRTHTLGNVRWVPQCLMGIGFKPLNLLDPYHKFYKSREHSVYWPGKSLHVLRVIANLVEQSLNEADRTFATSCLDVICDYLIDLQTMVDSDNSVSQLKDQFTLLQNRMNHFLN